MNEYEKLLSNNRQWAEEVKAQDPDFFQRLSHIQNPDFLWIGCSDSRVPADRITGTQPGEIFVHRNIANMVVHTDVNLLSVLDFAVNHLKVKHVIVCGHYNCGGIKAAMSRHDYNYALNMWLRNIKDVYRLHRQEMDRLPDEQKKLDRLVELNVVEQVHHLAKTSVIQRSWKNANRPHLHGWVYSLQNGLIKPLMEMAPNTALDPLYEYDDL